MSSNVAESMRNSKVGLFGERKSLDEALEYANEICGKNPETITALMVYHNTLMELWAQTMESVEIKS